MKYTNANNTLIIFEGHDNAGKSTIANKLSTLINVPVFKHERASMQSWDTVASLLYAYDAIAQLCENVKPSIIFDRLFPSEYAYSRVTKRLTIDKKIFELDKRFSKLNTFIIVCYKQSNKYISDDTSEVSIIEYNALTEAYIKFAKMSECEVLLLDTSNEQINTQLNKILTFINA